MASMTPALHLPEQDWESDTLSLERLEGSTFSLPQQVPEWFAIVERDAVVEGDRIRFDDPLTFVGKFVRRACDFWERDRGGRLRSGVHHQTSENGVEHYLELSAERWEGTDRLLIELLGSDEDRLARSYAGARGGSMAPGDESREGIPVFSLEVARDGTVTSVRPETHLGIELARQDLSLSLEAMLPAGRDETLRKAIGRAIANGAPQTVELNVGDEAHPRHYALHVRPEGDRAAVEVRETSERKAIDFYLGGLALLDPLTGVANRQLLSSRLRHAVVRVRRYGGRVAVLVLDLDGFKAVNDAYGHPVGDRLLQAVAERLRTVSRQTDTLGRWGGDEFVLVIEDLASFEDVRQVAERLLACFLEPFELDGYTVSITTSVGAAVCPDDGADEETLLRLADQAMYRVKRTGKKSYALAEDRIERKIRERSFLVHDFERAVEEDELVLVYQPQVDVRSGEVVGVEALLRWDHPGLGRLLPGEFLKSAAVSGALPSMEDWVLGRALDDYAEWIAAGCRGIGLAVNVSDGRLRESEVIDRFRSALEDSSVPAGRLELEVSERLVAEMDRHLARVVDELRELDVHLTLGGFGTGTASLTSLRRFPLHRLKIDRAFVKSAVRSDEDRSVCSAIVGLAQGLNLDVVAEGVEMPEHMTELAELGCRTMQGFLFAAPLGREDVVSFVRSFPRHGPHLRGGAA
jgi:diguanylate cyclase (GGDEF)-like protein